MGLLTFVRQLLGLTPKTKGKKKYGTRSPHQQRRRNPTNNKPRAATTYAGTGGFVKVAKASHTTASTAQSKQHPRATVSDDTTTAKPKPKRRYYHAKKPGTSAHP